ncbi:uncharacterized protein LOC110669659, partial [Hevea brasiliensis]|uniref:uncharacterized protein LOC110669659 n=1 Tax=Hevea brasiliensis TaxID=3981 RepID=UPI0025ECA71F
TSTLHIAGSATYPLLPHQADTALATKTTTKFAPSPITQADVVVLPPAPVSLLTPPNSIGLVACLQAGQPNRVRSFTHVEGNYALHVGIPLSSFLFQDIVCLLSHEIFVALGREFHISLGRTVPVRVHQVDSVIAMVRRSFILFISQIQPVISFSAYAF